MVLSVAPSADAESSSERVVPAIEVDALVKHYGNIKAVDGVSFTVESGEVFALLGPNGAGKTTIVETLEGYRKPDGGTVRVLGLDPIKQARTVKQQTGLMLQESSIYGKIRVGEAAWMFASYYKNPRDIDSLLELVGLAEHRKQYFDNLSGGQKQRLSLAMALVGNPRVAFLDEPTASMDPQARLQTWEIIRGLRDDGVTTVLTTHYMEEAHRLADRVAIVDRGKLVAIGRPDDLIGDSDTEIITFSGSPGLDLASLARRLHTARVLEERPGAYSITTGDALSASAVLQQWRTETGAEIDDFRVGTATLEDVFLQLTGSKMSD